MILDKDKALIIAKYLLKIKAVKLQPDNPFTWSSGWKSPIYCDNRKILSFPEIRTAIRQTFAEQIKKQFSNVDVIAGVATGAIAIGALVAEEMGLPFIYVRSSAKGHGLKNMVEGSFNEGDRIVVIEDLISTGGSSLKAVEAIRESGGNVIGTTAIFTYGFKSSTESFISAKCPLFTLTDYEHLIQFARETSFINESDIESLISWKESPQNWN